VPREIKTRILAKHALVVVTTYCIVRMTQFGIRLVILPFMAIHV
jgi:hypothetical protein